MAIELCAFMRMLQVFKFQRGMLDAKLVGKTGL